MNLFVNHVDYNHLLILRATVHLGFFMNYDPKFVMSMNALKFENQLGTETERRSIETNLISPIILAIIKGPILLT